MTDLLEQIENAVSRHQPELDVSTDESTIVVDGDFVISGPDGPFDSYKVRITVTAGFPLDEPKVFEIGNRLPKDIDRHVFPSGACCLGIWEEWLATSSRSFEDFLTGIVHDYFVSQTYFELTGKWPFGERSHGNRGIIESYSEVLEVNIDDSIVGSYLELLSQASIKGHSWCPCGSGQRLRNCHIDKVSELRFKIPADLSKRMLNRIKPRPASRKPVR